MLDAVGAGIGVGLLNAGLGKAGFEANSDGNVELDALTLWCTEG